MSGRYIVKGQYVDEGLRDRARQFRRAPTPAERVLWEALRGRRLVGLRFRRQQVIDGYVADFFCDAAGLIVEVDGGVHGGDEQRQYDLVRDQELAADGLRMLRISNDDVLQQLPRTLERIAAAAMATFEELN